MLSLGLTRRRAFHIDWGRVRIRPPRQSDWKPWARLRSESSEFLVPWEPTWPPDALTRSAFRRRVRIYNAEWRQGTGYGFLVIRREDAALLGGVTITNVRRGVSQSAMLGYWVGARYARQGYMSEALQASMEFVFDHLGLHRLEAACLPDNVPSRALLMKCGFQIEGLARKFLRINGKWSDHVLFAILRDDPRRRIEPLESARPENVIQTLRRVS